MHEPCFFVFDIKFISLLYILYHASCMWQLLNFMMNMMMILVGSVSEIIVGVFDCDL